MASAKQDALDKIVSAVREKFGEDSIVRWKEDQTDNQAREVIPTGLDVVDRYVLGCGGLVVGRVSEIFGEESTGKSSYIQMCLASVQRIGGKAALVDTERSYDPDRSKLFGVKTDDLLVSQPDTMEEALGVIQALIASNNPKHGPMLVAWDTLASTITKKMMAGIPGDSHTGEISRLTSQEFPKIIALLEQHRTHFIVGNQLRVKMGVFFGNNTTTPGGNVVKHSTSQRLQFFGGKAVKDGDEHIGKIVTIMAMKSRFSPPFRKAKARLLYMVGWDNAWSTLEHAKTLGIVKPRTPEASDAVAASKLLGWPAPKVLNVPASEDSDDGATASDEDL